MQLTKLVAYGSLVSALALGPGAALADNEASNDTTGPDSTNTASVEVKNDLDVDVRNDADFDARLTLDFNTGKNEVEKNTTAGDNESGDVDVDISGRTEISQGGADLCDCLGGMFDMGDNSASNHLTGPKSKNRAEVTVKNKADVDVVNDADVDLKVNADVNTGYNDTKMNTTAGDTKSGSVSFKFDWTTTINQGS